VTERYNLVLEDEHHESYSLKNLCREFEIDLTIHHRALCEAMAVAELLKLVNLKRFEDL